VFAADLPRSPPLAACLPPAKTTTQAIDLIN
jgi:hypothetical protein